MPDPDFYIMQFDAHLAKTYCLCCSVGIVLSQIPLRVKVEEIGQNDFSFVQDNIHQSLPTSFLLASLIILRIKCHLWCSSVLNHISCGKQGISSYYCYFSNSSTSYQFLHKLAMAHTLQRYH